MMDCDTTGVEPDFSLVKSKKLVGGGEITIVNRTVPMALDKLGYAPTEVRGGRRVHRRAQHRRRRAVRQDRALPGLRLRDRRARDPLHGPREDDGRRPAVHLGRDLEDREHAGAGDGRGGRRALRRLVAARREGDRDLPRQLQGRAAAVREVGQGARRRRCRDLAGRADGGQAAAPAPAARTAPRSAASSASATTRATSTSACTRTARRATSSSTSPRTGRRSQGLMNSLMIAVSMGLQYGVPPEVYVSKLEPHALRAERA